MREVANSKSRRLLAYDESFRCKGAQIGEAVLFYEEAARKKKRRRRSTAERMGIDDAGAPAKVQSQTLQAARYCAGKKVEEKDVEEAKWNPPSNQPKPMEPAPWANGNLRVEVHTMPSTGTSGGSPHYSPEAKPVPGPPSLSAQASSLPTPSVKLPAPESTLDRKCEQSQAPAVDWAPRSELTREQPHAQCSQLGYSRRGFKKVLKTRLACRGAAEANHISAGRDDMDTSEIINGNASGRPRMG